MKIKLSGMSLSKGGDIVALSNLLNILEVYRDFHYPKDNRNQTILGLWIRYLEGIENHHLAANMGRVPEKLTFDLPFERDFTKEYRKELPNVEQI